MTDTVDQSALVAKLEARIRAVEDHQALSQLVASYGPAVDSGSADAAAALWTDNGVFDVVPYFELVGHEGIAGMVNGAGHQSLIRHGCGHVLSAPKIVVDGDRASGWNYACNIRWDQDADRFWIARLSANKWEFERGDEGWLVVRRTNVNLDGTERSRNLFRDAAEQAHNV